MAVSGHMSENSIRNNARTDEGHKRKMAEAIGNAVTATGPSKRQKGVADNASDLVQFLEQDPSNGSGNMTEFSSADGLSDMDLMALTDSQEAMLLNDITNSMQSSRDGTVPVHPQPPATVFNIPKHKSHQVVMNFSGVDAVHIHYH